jgi:hypothetical protein
VIGIQICDYRFEVGKGNFPFINSRIESKRDFYVEVIEGNLRDVSAVVFPRNPASALGSDETSSVQASRTKESKHSNY